jgi:glycosyltransferase involved in cell wall biosynthesis
VIADCGLAERHAVKVVTNIVDPADVTATPQGRVSLNSKRIRIGYLQVAQSVKGFDLLPGVIEELSDIHNLVRFLIFAKRNGHPSWDQLASLPFNVVEERPRTAKVGDIYAECDIVFSPSRAESFNRVAAEALATGTPLVASDLAPVREVVGEAGLLFPPGDLTAAADCLRRLVHDADLREVLSRAGIARSHAWLPGPVAEEFLNQYRGAKADRVDVRLEG